MPTSLTNMPEVKFLEVWELARCAKGIDSFVAECRAEFNERSTLLLGDALAILELAGLSIDQQNENKAKLSGIIGDTAIAIRVNVYLSQGRIGLMLSNITMGAYEGVVIYQAGDSLKVLHSMLVATAPIYIPKLA